MPFCDETKFNDEKSSTPRAMNYVHSTQELTINNSFKSSIYVDKNIHENNGQVRWFQHY